MHPGGVLWISRDSDDRIMGAKIKNPKKFLGLPARPQKIPGPEINPTGLEIISRLAPVKLSGQTYFCSDKTQFWPDKCLSSRII